MIESIWGILLFILKIIVEQQYSLFILFFQVFCYTHECTKIKSIDS
jgi:hypothetical protein